MIYLIGTSHIAKESLEKVRENILEKKPDIVAVELDMARFAGLQQKKKGNIKLPFFQKMIVLILQNMQSRLSEETGILPGQEMLDATKYAKKVDSKVALIDQKINVTIDKLIKSMGVFEKIKFMIYLVIGFLGLDIFKIFGTKETIDLNKIPEDGFIDYAMRYMKTNFPSIYKVLVSERNRYMAYNLQKLSGNFESIIAVVGAGHIKGIKKILDKNKVDARIL